MTASYRFVVRGRVQGVFFRQSTVERARALGIVGWVRNRDDGFVDGIASGSAEALEQLRAWLQHGPPAARVESVEWVDGAEEAVGGGFVIR
ncbi:MAG TPA: acylphosphatase [Verrucomicrobiae bacterium]|nr:acylphosphatase [Verrucomicrobiae bacterium]